MACPIFLEAQKLFQQPKTIQRIIGRNNFEYKEWMYRASPYYVKKNVFNDGVYRFTIPPTHHFNFPGNREVIKRDILRTTTKYYLRSLGFFCQKELQLDKISPVPFRFRLGSLDYVNWMEQKPNAIKPR
ncbi:MAG: hypothetical protein HZB42_11040 [Sphingobacteriales bacterium]|nr:hypothetical protein [Sphingobacteriales bacterium]